MIPSWVYPSIVFAVVLLTSNCKQQESQKSSAAQKPNEQKRVAAGDQTDSNGTDGDDLGSIDGDSDGDGTAITAQLIEECGIADIVNAAPDQVIYSKSMRSLPAQENVLGVRIRASASLNINVTPSTTVQDARVNIESINGLFANLAQGAAQQMASSRSGIVTLQNLKPDEMTGIGDKFPQWNGVICTFTAASRLTNTRGGQNITVSFDPPIPINISPRAAAQRYQTEIGQQRVFQNMTATIESSSNPNLPVGTKVTGTVSVVAIEPAVTIKQVNGQFTGVRSDVAYRVTYNFGSPQATFLLGLPPEVIYYISHTKRDVVGTVINAKEANVPPFVFLTP